MNKLRLNYFLVNKAKSTRLIETNNAVIFSPHFPGKRLFFALTKRSIRSAYVKIDVFGEKVNFIKPKSVSRNSKLVV